MGFCYVMLLLVLFCEEHCALSDVISRNLYPCKSAANGKPRGHLDRLGCQRSPTGNVDEYFTAPSPKELWEGNVRPYKPAVIRNGLGGSFALSAWDDEYIRENYGDQEVLIEKKYEDRRSEPKRMTISDFLDNYHKQNWYIVSLLPNAMRKDIRIPKPLMCGSFRKNLAELNLWIGTNGTRSMLHYDADNILHCVVSGWKDWMLFHPKYKPKLDMVLNSENQASGFSHLNVEKIDNNLHPEIWDVPWENVTLRSGDCLYLPARYLHQVRSYERSISVTFLFYPEGGFKDTDCKDVDFNINQSLDDAYVYWTLEKGQETVDMGYMNPEVTKMSILVGLEMIGKTRMDFKMYLYILASMVSDYSLEMDHIEIFDGFKKFDRNGDGVITRLEIETMDMETLKEWCRAADNPHGPKKSQLNKNKKYTGQTADFAPRRAPNSLDSSYALIFLKYVIRALGENEQITYTKFKKWIKVQDGTIADAFLIFDRNFDGVITLQEIKNAPAKRLRDFSKMYYSIKGTNIRGGGVSTDEVEKNSIRLLTDLSSIPTSNLAAFKEQETENDSKILETILLTLKDLSLKKEYINEDDFTKVVKDSIMANLYEPNTLDIGFFFNLLDRGEKGYISKSDIDFYIADAEVYLFEKSDASYGGQVKNDAITPCDFITKMLSVMDQVGEILKIKENMEKSNQPQVESLDDIIGSRKLGKDEL